MAHLLILTAGKVNVCLHTSVWKLFKFLLKNLRSLSRRLRVWIVNTEHTLHHDLGALVLLSS